jgi:uncharacterized protein (TIRG00374 family)
MMLSQEVKGLLNWMGRLLLSGVLLAYLYHSIDLDKTAALVKSADLTYVFYSFILYSIIHVFILLRWGVFIRALGLQAPVLNVVRFFFIGLFGNLFLPSAIGGDVIKTLGLCKDIQQKPKVVASVLLDRLSGFAGMVVVAIAAFVMGYRYINDMTLLVSIGIMAAVSTALAFVLFNERLYTFCCRIFNQFPRLKSGLMRVHYDIVLLKGHYQALFQSVGLSCLGQIVLAVVWYLLAKSLHQNIAFIYFLIFVPLICVVSVLPSVGGLGVREAGAAFLLTRAGVESGVSVSISLLNFAFMVLMGLVGGVIFITTKSSRILNPSAPGPEALLLKKPIL